MIRKRQTERAGRRRGGGDGEEKVISGSLLKKVKCFLMTVFSDNGKRGRAIINLQIGIVRPALKRSVALRT